MSSIRKHAESKGRCLALFPGAFRPPHINHFSVVKDLASRPEVDEVVVIVTNRCRNIPGTTKTLDTDVALRIWAIYLQDLPQVRVEVAPKSAVKHALGYFDRVDAGDALIFSVGERDLREGDGRFKKIEEMARHRGITASVIEGPPNAVPVRATDLRKALALGEPARETFMAGLPSHLNSAQRTEVWSICRQSMQEARELIMNKVRGLFERDRLGDIEDISVAKSGKRDEIFSVRLTNGSCLFVKYANDTVKTAMIGKPGDPKPRKRLKAERDAIKWLRANASCEVEIPDVILFDRGTRTLILTDVCPGGRSLQDDLRKGIFDPAVAKKASRFLAECHSAVGKLDPLWDDETADLDHWRRMLTLRTGDIKGDEISEKIRRDLQGLREASDKARENRFVNLDYSPKNIFVGEGRIGVIDFELSSSIGDPAYDFGLFLGHYIFWGLTTSARYAYRKALLVALNAYQQTIGSYWLTMRSRITAFAGACILDSIIKYNQLLPQETKARLLQTGETLLSCKYSQQAPSLNDILTRLDGLN